MTTNRHPIAVLGGGHVGLVTAVCLAHLGHAVSCADADPEKVGSLQHGTPTIYEDGLQDLLESGLRSGRLRFTSDNAETVTDADFVFLCLPAPGQPDGSTDLSSFEDVCRAVGPHLRPGAVIVNKSTLPIGSTEVIGSALGREDVAIVSCPEFLREGTAIADTLHPSRIVVGATDDRAANRVVELFVDVDAPVLVTTPSAAEMIKYVSIAVLSHKAELRERHGGFV